MLETGKATGRIALALGGGAGLGWAHIGVIRALEAEFGLKADLVTGTSMGAIVGAAYAADLLDPLEELARSLGLRRLVSLGRFGFGEGAILGAARIEAEMRRYFGDRQIEDLSRAFVAVAADIHTGQLVTLDRGDLVEALRASSAIPGIFPPVRRGGQLLVDGGILEPIPVQAAWDKGADYVIAVNLQGDYSGALLRARIQAPENKTAEAEFEADIMQSPEDALAQADTHRAVFYNRFTNPLNIQWAKMLKRRSVDNRENQARLGLLQLSRAAFSLSLKGLAEAKLSLSQPSLVISPAIGHFEASDFTKAEALIDCGMDAVRQARPAIEALLKSKT